jgi:hypothetical protein
LWLVALAILGLIGVVVYTYRAYRQAATDVVLERDEQLTVLSASRLQSDLADYADLLILLARSSEMSKGTMAIHKDALLAAAPRLAVFDGGVVVLDSRGRVHSTLPEQPALIAQDWSGRDFFRDVLGGAEMAFSDSQQVTAGGPFVVVVAVPIRAEDNAFVGALAGMFRLGEPTLSSFYASIVRLRLGQTGTTYVVDGSGRVLYDSEAQRVSRFLDTSQLSLITSPTSAARLMQDIAGNDVLAANAPVPGTRWTLIVEDDWSVVTGATARYRDILLLSFVAALLLPPLGLSLLMRQRRFRFLDVRRPEQDDGWVKMMRERLRPAQLPVLPGWNLHADQVSGSRPEHEFFDVYLRLDGRLMVVLGKISATGVQGALALTAARATIRSASLQLLGPAEALQQCNSLLCMQHELELSLRTFCLLIDPATDWLEYACAGVSPPRQNGRYILQEPPAAGQPMGLKTELEVATGRVHIEPGALCVLLGPSMSEAHDVNEQAFVSAALPRVLDERVIGLQEQAERIADAFRAFNARSPFFPPDLTVVLLERLAPTS